MSEYSSEAMRTNDFEEEAKAMASKFILAYVDTLCKEHKSSSSTQDSSNAARDSTNLAQDLDWNTVLRDHVRRRSITAPKLVAALLCELTRLKIEPSSTRELELVGWHYFTTNEKTSKPSVAICSGIYYKGARAILKQTGGHNPQNRNPLTERRVDNTLGPVPLRKLTIPVSYKDGDWDHLWRVWSEEQRVHSMMRASTGHLADELNDGLRFQTEGSIFFDGSVVPTWGERLFEEALNPSGELWQEIRSKIFSKVESVETAGKITSHGRGINHDESLDTQSVIARFTVKMRGAEGETQSVSKDVMVSISSDLRKSAERESPVLQE